MKETRKKGSITFLATMHQLVYGRKKGNLPFCAQFLSYYIFVFRFKLDCCQVVRFVHNHKKITLIYL